MSAAKPKALIEVPIAMRWRDLDAFKHANNSSFLTYIEEARLRWFESIDGECLTAKISPVVAATHVNYRRQLAWPANLIVELYCERRGNTSLTLAHRIVDSADRGLVYSDGQTVLVWINTASGRPVALPDAINRACQ